MSSVIYKNSFLFLFILLGFIQKSFSANGNCMLDWSGTGVTSTANVSVNYSALNVTASKGTCAVNSNFSFFIGNNDNSGQNTKYLYYGGIPTNNDTKRIHIKFFKSNLSELLSNSQITGGLPSNNNPLSYSTYIDPAALAVIPALVAGDYCGDFSMSLTNTSTNKADDRTGVLKICFHINDQEPMVDVALSPTSTNFASGVHDYKMDFINMKTNDEKFINLIIKYNTKYKISFVSLNAVNPGKLQWQKLPINSLKYVDYQIKLGSNYYTLSSVALEPSETSNFLVRVNSPVATTSTPLGVKIGNVSNQPSGEYTDTVRITITSTN